MTTATESIFTKTETEYNKMDKLYSKKRALFATLKNMEAEGLYGSSKWGETFAKYAETFKACHGYRPHWAH